MQARKKSMMWERRLSTIYHCCADMPWEESCAESPNIGTSILAAVISDLVWGTFQTQGAHNEGLASHEEPAAKLKGHVNCSDIPTDFCCFRDAILIPRKQGVPFSALLTDAAGSYLGFIRGFLSAKTTADNSIWCNFLKMLSLNWIKCSAGKKSLLLCKIQAPNGLKLIKNKSVFCILLGH